MSILLLRLRLFILLSFARLKGEIINFWKGLSFNRNKSKDQEAYIDEISEIEPIEQEEYNAFFLKKSAISPIYMPRATWLKISNGLPDNYVFPSPEMIRLMTDELEKHRAEKIDFEIVERIKNQLPQNYSLHNPFVFQNNIDKPFVSNRVNEVDYEVHGQISNNLPSDYKFS